MVFSMPGIALLLCWAAALHSFVASSSSILSSSSSVAAALHHSISEGGDENDHVIATSTRELIDGVNPISGGIPHRIFVKASKVGKQQAKAGAGGGGEVEGDDSVKKVSKASKLFNGGGFIGTTDNITNSSSSKAFKAEGSKTNKLSSIPSSKANTTTAGSIITMSSQGEASVVATGDDDVKQPATIQEYCHASCDNKQEGGVCTFTARVDLYASEFGFYHFDECPDAGNMPTITVELGKIYRFVQKDVTNYYHPLGFAYRADGALVGAEEVDEAQYLSYQWNGQKIGLETYEPMFAHPIEEWATAGEFVVELFFPTNFTYTEDLFYFCHIHRHLGGRIKLTRNNGTIIQPENLPVHDVYPPSRSSYDQICGTFGLVLHQEAFGGSDEAWTHNVAGDHRTPHHPQCPNTFVCEEDKSTFATCLDAINCHMFSGMTTYERDSEVELFIHQMIPHHQNAVNMAKSLLLHWDYACNATDLGMDGIECVMENILRSIIAGQNAQIQTMRDLLQSNDWPEFDDCDVPTINSSAVATEKGSDYVYGPWYGWGDGDQDVKNLQGTEGEGQGDNAGRSLGDDGICRGSCSTTNGTETCVFTVGVNLYASDLGAYYFEECGKNNTYPVIGVEVGKTYVFVQADRSNYYHPLRFAYNPDGANKTNMAHMIGKDEFEENYLTYMLDSEHVGLDGYHSKFLHSLGEWASYGTFSVELNYNKEYDQDLFYFCHIHKFMSGRIKLLKNNEPIQSTNLPTISYTHPKPSDYDKSCGTFGLAPFQLPHPECPEAFVCDKKSQFAGCLESMNCYMMVGMTTYADRGNDGDVALFNYQMIPHHENAVNMAKALLKTGVLECPNLTEESDDCTMEIILREIVNNQNLQIQQMYGVLDAGGFSKTNDCVVKVQHNNLFGDSDT